MRRRRNSRRNRYQRPDSNQNRSGFWIDPDGNPHMPDEQTGQMVPYQDQSTQRINSGYQHTLDERVESLLISQDNLLDVREVTRNGWDEVYDSNPLGFLFSFVRGIGDDRRTYIPAFQALTDSIAQSTVQGNQSVNSFHAAMIDAPRQTMEAQNALRVEGMGRDLTRHHDGRDMAQQMDLEYKQTHRLEDDALERAITFEIVQSQNRLALILAHTRTQNPKDVAIDIIREVIEIGESLEPLTEELSAADKEAVGELTQNVIHKLITQKADDRVLDALSKIFSDGISSERPRVGSFHRNGDDEGEE